MNVVVMIDGREAIPVRAIPFVTGWGMSPDVVAKSLARTTFFDRLEGVKAYHLSADGVAPMLPKEWDGIEADLAIFSDKLQATETVEQENYPVWRRESISLLPSACFLWRDEFEAAFRTAYSEKRLHLADEREGERDLNFMPRVPPDLAAVVMEGFSKTTVPSGLSSSLGETASDGEQNKLLKQIGAMALVLADKHGRYKVGDRPNANQIADAVRDILDALPDISLRGLGKSSLRESIRAGIELLNK